MNVNQNVQVSAHFPDVGFASPVISFQKGMARNSNWPVLFSLNWLVPEDLKL